MKKWTKTAGLLFMAASSVYYGQAVVAAPGKSAPGADSAKPDAPTNVRLLDDLVPTAPATPVGATGDATAAPPNPAPPPTGPPRAAPPPPPPPPPAGPPGDPPAAPATPTDKPPPPPPPAATDNNDRPSDPATGKPAVEAPKPEGRSVSKSE